MFITPTRVRAQPRALLQTCVLVSIASAVVRAYVFRFPRVVRACAFRFPRVYVRTYVRMRTGKEARVQNSTIGTIGTIVVRIYVRARFGGWHTCHRQHA